MTSYKTVQKSALIIAVLLVITSVFAQTADTGKKSSQDYLTRTSKLVSKLNGYESSAPNDITATIEILYKAEVLKGRQSDYIFSDKDLQTLKSRDDAFRNVLETRIKRQHLDTMSGSDFNAKIAQAQKSAEEEGFTGKITANKGLYKSTIFYPSVFSFGLLGGIIAAILVLCGIVFAAKRGMFSGFGSFFSSLRSKVPVSKASTTFKNVLFFWKKTKEEGPQLKKKFEEKETLIRKNQEHFAEFHHILEKESYGAIHEMDVKSLEEDWVRNVVEPLAAKNKEIEELLEKIKKFLDYFEKGDFMRRYSTEFKKDLESMADFESRMKITTGHIVSGDREYTQVDDISSEFVQRVEVLKRALDEERKLVSETFPDYNKIANAVMGLVGRMKLEDTAVRKEKDSLRALQGGLTGEAIKTQIEFLSTAAAAKRSLFEEEKKLFAVIEEMEKKVGAIIALEEGKLEEEAKKRRELEFSKDMLKDRRKYFMYSKAESPLLIRNNTKNPIRQVQSLGELWRVLQPKTSPNPQADIIDDIPAFMLFQKQSDGKSELYQWLSEEYPYKDLADEIQKVIDDERLPLDPPLSRQETFTEAGHPASIITIGDSGVIKSLNRIRKKAVHLISSYYHPIKQSSK